MSSAQQVKAWSSTLPATLFKEQEELFRRQNQEIARLMSMRDACDRVLGNARHPHRYNLEKEGDIQDQCRFVDDEIQKLKNEIEEIKKDQNSWFQELLKEERERMWVARGLENLEGICLPVDEVVQVLDVPAASKKEDVTSNEGNMFGESKTDKGKSRRANSPPQLSDEPPEAPCNRNNASQRHDEQAEWQSEESDTFLTPHERVEALGGATIPQQTPSSSLQPYPKQLPSPLDGIDNEIAPQLHEAPRLKTATIEEDIIYIREQKRLLDTEWERSKRALNIDLERSKKTLRKIRESIKTAEMARRKLPTYGRGR